MPILKCSGGASCKASPFSGFQGAHGQKQKKSDQAQVINNIFSVNNAPGEIKEMLKQGKLV
jgi:hypothetical protein